MENATPPIDRRLLRLSAQDNVLIAMETLPSGSSLSIGEKSIALGAAVPLGYKLAARDIEQFEKIVKYGVSIGSAVRRIATGEVVHTHNMQSDYLPTYSREGTERFVNED